MSKFQSFPREGDSIRPIRLGNNHYFALGGWSDPTLADKYPNYAYFAKQSDSKATPLLLGHLYHEPAPTRGQWGFWFNARGLDFTASYQLIIARVDPKTGGTTLLGWVEKLRINGGLEAIDIDYPSGTVPAGTISPYGSYTNPDTTVTRVELLQNGVVVAVDNNPYADGGFWAASFPNVAAGTYTVRVVGNSSSKMGAPFDVQ